MDWTVRPAKIRYAGAMTLPSLAEIREAQAVIYRYMPPTPQYSWPLTNKRLEAEVWIKHENHTPIGAFKLRGALVYIEWLKQSRTSLEGVVAATRGNHGQGVGMAARLLGLKAVVVVPHGNSVEKNCAMLAQGVELVERGHDFQESLEFARTLAKDRGFEMVDSFHERLVMGTATYGLELFESVPALDTVYVPIGLGSSICGVAAARNALGSSTKIVGVVSSESPSYSLSFEQRKVVEAPSRTLIADGLACRTPNPSGDGGNLGERGPHRRGYRRRDYRRDARSLSGHAQCRRRRRSSGVGRCAQRERSQSGPKNWRRADRRKCRCSDLCESACAGDIENDEAAF